MKPLTEILRPRSFNNIIGQAHLCGQKGVIRQLSKESLPVSFVLWGEPGSGKTTIIEVYLNTLKVNILRLTGSTFNLKKVKEYCKKAEKLYKFSGQQSVIFIDEIHRLNKAQQDIFLYYLEKGGIYLLGASTENPSFELNKALLSRVKIFVLNSLDKKSVFKILENVFDYLETEKQVKVEKGMKEFLFSIYGPDVRSSINSLDMFIRSGTSKKEIKIDQVKKLITDRKFFYDKNGEFHYNIISAFHKSIRNSDVDSALYWLARMIVAGEDRKYILRRMIRIAGEDIGLSDPEALTICLSAFKAFEIIGMPEGDIFLFYACVYLALSPKSDSIYKSESKAKSLAKKTSSEQVPLYLRNPESKLMKKMGYGEGYKYAHDYEEKTTTMNTLPEGLKNVSLFLPEKIGFEKKILKRYKYWKNLKEKLENKK